MKDYSTNWYNHDDWEFRYVVTVVKKPRFESIDDLSKHIEDVKEVKGDYEVVQETSTLLYENAVFVNKGDGRIRFVIRDDATNYELNAKHVNVQPEHIEKRRIEVNGKYYPYAEDIVPELEHREFSGHLDKLKAIFRETPVKELDSKSELMARLTVSGQKVIKEV